MDLKIFNIMVNTIKRILSGMKGRPIPAEILFRSALAINTCYDFTNANKLIERYSEVKGYAITLDESHYIYIADCGDNLLFNTISLSNGNTVYIIGTSLFEDIRADRNFIETYSLLELCYKLAIVYYNGYKYPWVSKANGLYNREPICDKLEALMPAALFLVSTNNTEMDLKEDSYLFDIITGYDNSDLDNYNEVLEESMINIVTCIHADESVRAQFRMLLEHDSWLLGNLFI